MGGVKQRMICFSLPKALKTPDKTVRKTFFFKEQISIYIKQDYFHLKKIPPSIVGKYWPVCFYGENLNCIILYY